MRVLLVEGDDVLRSALTRDLVQAGFAVDAADDGRRGALLATGGTCDVAILDLDLPGIAGLEVLRQWRASGQSMPVLVLTAREQRNERVLALQAGADDHLGKPFHGDELLARLGALLRRRQPRCGTRMTREGVDADDALRATGVDNARHGAPTAPTLRLLRDPALDLGAGSILALSRKDAALLALLALDGACARDTLAALLWPAQTPARALGSLRQRRFRLARAAGLPLVEGDATLRLSAAVAHPFAAPEAVLAADLQALDGELLEGQAFDDCPAFDQWLLAARERWRVQRTQALARVASRLENGGRLAQALACAEHLVAGEPLSDHAHRRLMRLHHLRGDLGAALNVYRRFAERLDAELGELPDDETAALAAALRQGEAPVRAAAPMPATLRRPARRVGRDAAWQALLRAWDERADVVVDGAPGVGKSRLLADFAADRARGGDAVLMLAARAGDADQPYTLLGRLLGRLWLDDGAASPCGWTVLPTWAQRELAALLPELGPAPARLDPLRLQRALAAALQAAALALVVVDDAQSADLASLELLPALAGPAAPRWWLGVRAGEHPAPLAAWLDASVAPRRLALAPLDAAGVEALLDDLALGDLRGPQWARSLMRHTGGLPLFLLETLRSLHESGDVGTGPSVLARLTPTVGAAQLVRARLGRLPEPARQLAHAAAVLDVPLTLEVGAGVLGDAPRGWVDACDALEAAHWLDERGRMHDLVRAAVHQAMPAAELRWLHGRAAAWLAAQDAAPVVVARHWRAAGRDALAAPAFEIAARLARRASRPAEEAALWTEAAGAWSQSGDAGRAFDARRRAIPPRLFAGGPGAALPLAERLVADADTPPRRARALELVAHVRLVLGDDEAASAPAAEAMRLARDMGDDETLVDAGCSLSAVQAQNGDADAALAALEALRPHAEACRRHLRQTYESQLALVLHRLSRLGESSTALQRALEIARAAQDWREACTLTGNLAMIFNNLGRHEAAWQAAREALALRDRLGPTEGVQPAGIDLVAGGALLGLGRIGSAIDAFEHAGTQLAHTAAEGSWGSAVDHGLAAAHLLRGDTDAAAAALRPLAAGTPPYIVARRHLLRAWIAKRRDADPRAALAEASAALDGGTDAMAQLVVEAESALMLAAPDDAATLAALQARAAAIEQDALAMRLAWWRVDALRRAGRSDVAAAEARTLLQAPAGPSALLPSHRYAIAQAALAAAGAADAEVWHERARQAHRETLADLGSRAGPGTTPHR